MVVPRLRRQLAGYDGGAAGGTIVEDLERIISTDLVSLPRPLPLRIAQQRIGLPDLLDNRSAPRRPQMLLRRPSKSDPRPHGNRLIDRRAGALLEIRKVELVPLPSIEANVDSPSTRPSDRASPPAMGSLIVFRRNVSRCLAGNDLYASNHAAVSSAASSGHSHDGIRP